jgi:hypothetical protein
MCQFLPLLTVRTLCLIASLAKLALSNGSLRSLRYSPGAAVFVESDETSCLRISSVLKAFRRLLLQIGGANIAGADRAFELADFVVAHRR